MAAIPKHVTQTFIEKADDFDVLDQLVERFNIDAEHFDTVEDYKDALIKYLQISTCGSKKRELFEAIASAGSRDSDKREQLRALLEDVMKVFPETSTIQQQVLQELLHEDGVLLDLDVRAECRARIKNLSDNECAILIAGETSAGKSSLLNLLLGEEILPSNHLPCTSSITVIRYSDTRSARVIFTSGTQQVIPHLDEAGLAELKRIAFIDENSNDVQAVYERRRDKHNIAEIQVNLPLPFLKSGLVLVDSPGVGENEFLENYLMAYVRSHQILGFIYIIMSDQAGGIAEDRLVNLLSMIVREQSASNHILKFNPKAALFVCNRWDLVGEEYKEDVRQNAFKKLSKCWPDFEDSQVLTFSTSLAKKDRTIHKDYIGEEFTKLLEAIASLLETAVDRRSGTAYKWLGNILQRSYHYMKSVVWRLELSERDRAKTSQEARTKLETLQTKTEEVIKKLHKEIDSAVEDICKKARDFLKLDSSKEKITKHWTGRELPDLEKGSGGWVWIKNAIDAAVNDRLVECLEEWDKVQRHIPNQAAKMAREAKLGLSSLEKELSELEKEEEHAGDDVSVASYASLSSSFRCNSLQDLETDETVMSIPTKLFVRNIAKRITKRINESKTRRFRKEPGKMAEERSKKVLKSILHPGNQDLLQDIVRQLMQRPLLYVRRLESKIPKLIHANEMILVELERLCATHELHRTTFVDMMTRVEEIKRRLFSYGENFVYANDFSGDEIRLIKEKTDSLTTFLKSSLSDVVRLGASSEIPVDIPHGLWTSVYRGVSTSGHQEKHVSVRVYRQSVGLKNCFSEVAKLRCLFHADVCLAEFLGIHEVQDHPLPAFIFGGHLVSVRSYLSSHAGKTAYKSTSMKILTDICTGLQYLHAKGLVHMEITQDTLTVSERGEVQLSGCCMPRRANLENAQEMTASGFVYLAPEVLLGENYRSPADVYALALVLLEVLLKCEVFADQKSDNLIDFVKTLSPVNMLHGQIYSEILPRYLSTVISQCLSPAKFRPDISVVADKVKESERSGIFYLGKPMTFGSLLQASQRR